MSRSKQRHGKNYHPNTVKDYFTPILLGLNHSTKTAFNNENTSAKTTIETITKTAKHKNKIKNPCENRFNYF